MVKMTNRERSNSILVISSRTVSRLGDIMFDYANNTFLAGISPNSLILVGIYQSLDTLISIFLNLIGGVVADKVKRKKIIILADLISGLICVGLSLIPVAEWLVFAILITNSILAVLSSFSGPAYKAFTKEIVNKNSISKLNSYLELSVTIIKVIIPLIALALYQLLGVHGVLLLDGLSFLLSSALIFSVTPITEADVSAATLSVSGVFIDLVEGFKYLVVKKDVFGLMILSAVINFFLAAYNLVLPYSNQMFPKITVSLYAIFLAAEAIGGIVGAWLSGIVNKDLQLGKLIIYLGYGGVCLAVIPVVYLIHPQVIALSLSFALFNMFGTVFNIQLFSYIQQNVDLDYLGRVFGIIFTIAIVFMPFGTAFFTLVLNPNNSYNFAIIGLLECIASIIYYQYNKYSKRKSIA